AKGTCRKKALRRRRWRMSKPKSRSRSSRRPPPRWRAATQCRRAQLPSRECMRTVISIAVVAMACRGPAPAAAQDHTLRVPAGFKISVFAQNLEGVRYLALGPGTIVFGPDGKLYLAVGSSCNICDERDSLRAAVTRFNPDGSGGRMFAKGLRNTVGMAFNPATGELWGGNNDRDNLGDDLPPEHVN